MAFAILLLESSKSNFYSSWKGDKNSFWNSENGILSNFFLNEKSKTELTINKFLNESRNFRKIIDIARPIIYERVKERERKKKKNRRAWIGVIGVRIAERKWYCIKFAYRHTEREIRALI